MSERSGKAASPSKANPCDRHDDDNNDNGEDGSETQNENDRDVQHKIHQ